MAGQFELGDKHQKCAETAKNLISEIQQTFDGEANIKELSGKYLKKGLGQLPSESGLYDDYLSMALCIEELAKQNSLTAFILTDQIVFREILKTYSDIKAESILNEGELIGVLFVEPGFTTINNIQTKAVKTAQGWQIDGMKLVSNEQLYSDKYLILAKDEENKLRLFIISKKDITIEQQEKNISSSKVVMNNVKISKLLDAECLIGVIDNKFEKVHAVARTLIASASLGIAHSALVKSIEMARETKDSKGESLSASQNIQFTVVDMFAETEAARMLTYLSADSIDKNNVSIKIATMAKIKASEAACNVSMESLHLLGNIGFIANSDFASLIQSAVNTRVKGGTNRIQRTQVYEYMLAKK